MALLPSIQEVNKMSNRTDLAVEILDENARRLPKGVERKMRRSSVCSITEIIIKDHMAGLRLGKAKGRYVTVETDRLSAHPEDFGEQSQNIANEITSLMGNPKNLLVCGLGNESITPDALGPKTAKRIIATRHLSEENVGNELGSLSLRSVSVLSAGVMGQTGIESSEIILSLCDTVKPDCIIAVDALACSDISRLGTTIQITDTGISPGSGVQNRRKELSKAATGIPVIAVGVPTVVDMHSIICNVTGNSPDKHMPNMMVTTRDIDKLIDRTAHLLAFAINRAAQPSLSNEDILSLM